MAGTVPASACTVRPETGNPTDFPAPSGDMSTEMFEAAYILGLTVQPTALGPDNWSPADGGPRPADPANAHSIEARVRGVGNFPPGFKPLASVGLMNDAARWRLCASAPRRIALADRLTNTFTLSGRKAFARAAAFSALSVAFTILAAILIFTAKGSDVPGAVQLFTVGRDHAGVVTTRHIGSWHVKWALAVFVVARGAFTVADMWLSRDAGFLRRELVRLRWARSIASVALAAPTGLVATGTCSVGTVITTVAAVVAILGACWTKDALPNRYVDAAMMTVTAHAFAAGMALAIGVLTTASRADGVSEAAVGLAAVPFVWTQLLAGVTLLLNTSMSPVEAERSARHAVAITLYTGVDVIMAQAFMWTLYTRYT